MKVLLEKRLGIAQLCLLLVVLVFIGLTRGAPAHPPPLRRSTRELDTRNLSIGSSTDGWNPLRGRSWSPIGRDGNTKTGKAAGDYHLLI